jgi:ribonuclease HII
MIGIDEVGRGCWAGPLLVVAARQLSALPDDLADSKLVSKKRRQALIPAIEASCQLGKGWVEPAEIDQLGLTGAMRLAVKRALDALQAPADEAIIMDGNINYCPEIYTNVRCVIDADATEPLVSAASIFAKVRRDQKMTDLALEYPGYGFEKHVGYGTKAHMQALQQLGISVLHRQSYKPIQAYRGR